MVLLTLFLGFLVGALTIIAIEVFGVFLVIRRLNRKVKDEEAKVASQSAPEVSDLHHSSVASPNYKKQGVVWVLEPEKVPKLWLVDKVPKEQKRKKEIFEVEPIRKYAIVQDQSLILTESDGSHTDIKLEGCTVVAVSATALSSRKWAKKYPIKVESKTSVLYNGSKTVYVYLDTCWEKESWCKCLRLASCSDEEKLKWFAKLNLEFRNYLATLSTGYPSFMKPSVSFYAEPKDRSIKLDGSSSKVRHFLKILARKASKGGAENRAGWTLASGREERKIIGKCHSFQELVPSSTHSGSSSRSSVCSDADCDDKIACDEGTLGWNLLISRLFFDAKNNTEMNNSVRARIQRTLSSMRTPSYVGEITCTGIDLGNLPPHINGVRVLPLDMNEVWALEIDLQYVGGAVLDIETRLEVRELDFEEGMVDTSLESSSVGEVTSDLLEGFEYFGKQLELSEGAVDATEQKNQADCELDGTKSFKSTNRAPVSVSRWKSMLNSVAKQVSQVPLSLAIRVASLRGTLRLHIKPPPSDQIWYGFTSMPDIDFNLESSVGEHKISSAHIALFLASRFKTAIRETLVLPNCESVCVPWMLAEKDDWVPQKVAPFIWVNPEASTDEKPSSQLPAKVTLRTKSSRKATSNFPEDKLDEGKKVESSDQPIIVHLISDSSGPHPSSSDSAYLSSTTTTTTSSSTSKSLQELSTPLLSKDEAQAISEGSNEEENHTECQSPSQPLISTGEQIRNLEGEDMRPKRMGTRARMLGLGKKMGEKLEEKRRHIEEKGRNMVEKMRGPEK